jgi:parvulin-like peptidyl-prolyl isomerase
VKTRYGYHILKVNEKRPAGYKPFEEVRTQLASQAWDQKAKDDAREQIASVRARLEQVKPKDEAQVRNFTSATVTLNDAQWFGKTDQITGFGRLPQLTDWAFTAKDGDFGQIIDTPRGPIVPWLVASRGAGVSPLDEIRPRVEADARQAKAQEIAKQTLAQNLPAANIDELAKKVSSTTEEVTLNRSGFNQKLTGNIDQIVDAAMGAQVGEVKGPFLTSQGALAFQVVSQKRFDPAQFAKDRDAFMQTLRMNEARKLRASLLERLKKDANVEVNEALTKTNAAAQTPEG